MSPDEMSEQLAEWEAETWSPVRRVVYIEPEGPRRTWLLYEGGRQRGHVRLRATPTPRRVTAESGLLWGKTRPELVSVDEWTAEASDWARAMLGLDDMPQPGQTGSEG